MRIIPAFDIGRIILLIYVYIECHPEYFSADLLHNGVRGPKILTFSKLSESSGGISWTY